MLAILAFHKIGEPGPNRWETWYYTSATEFRGYLRYLRNHDWRVIDVPALLRGLAEPDALPERAALLTFDDGYRSILEVATPVLQEFGYPAVLFVPAAYVGMGSHAFDRHSGEPDEPLCDWDELRELERHGVSIQSHAVTHRAFSMLDPAQQDDELRGSKAILESNLQKQIELFSFPYGDGGKEPAEVSKLVERAGYRAACLYDGLVNAMPPHNPFRLSRLTLGRWTDPWIALHKALRGSTDLSGLSDR
jgi:peptidoglycan/xylan/chitin deacetylase (PgdA/CDA1 family)